MILFDKRKLGSLILAGALLCTNFLTVRAEETNPFVDVNPEKYYYQPIMTMYEKGVMAGYGNGYFGPDDSLTNAQVLVMLSRVCNADTSELGNGQTWYSGALEWAEIKLGITNVKPNEPATRFNIADYILKAFNKESLLADAAIDGDIPFSDTESPVAEVLYDLGVTAGMSDGKGGLMFGGDQALTRGQAATFFTRVLNLDVYDWGDITPAEHADYLKKEKLNSIGTHYTHEFYDSIKVPEMCTSAEDLTEAYKYMMANGLEYLEVITPFRTNDDVDIISGYLKEAYKKAAVEMPEYYPYTDGTNIQIRRNSDMKFSNAERSDFILQLTLYYDEGYDEFLRIFDDTEIRVHTIIEDLYKSGKLNDNMSIKEKTKALCEWMVLTYEYDLTYENYDMHSLMVEGCATCSGYTALYTTLCRHLGIDIKAERGQSYNGEYWGSHIWNYIDDCGECDGIHYIDVTWCDPTPDKPGKVSWDWFWVSENDWTDHIAD